MGIRSLAARTSKMVLCLAVMISGAAYGQEQTPVLYPDDPVELKRQFIEPTYFPEHITKKPGHYTITQWDDVIDETWGWGRMKSQKLAIFDAYWEAVDEDFACFPSLPGYYPEFWNDLRTLYRTEIENGDPIYGVSRGRFAAIMNYLAMDLKEGHTYVENRLVNSLTAPRPGVPLLVVGGWGINDHFGAGLTPLEDSTLVVYRAVDLHPLTLVPGDIVLGYDGIPWKELYQQMLDEQLPLLETWWWGCSESSYIHSLLMSAGMNWHLFDTIDILKYDTGETMHLSTSLLDHQNMEIFCTEQLDIPGVPMPDIRYGGERASFGIIDGTQIGYIYIIGWSGNVEEELFNAVSTLMNDFETTGLIIDSRTNYGGLMHLGQKAYELLFNTTEPAYGWMERCNISDHLDLCPRDDNYFPYIYGAANSYYDKPIAYLVGPGSISSGDFSPLAFKSHPMVRYFGRPTAAAFNGPRWTNMVYNNDWWGRYAEAESFLQNDPDQHLTRIEFPVDEEVWLTQDDVAQGNDTVVDAAVEWINSQSGNSPDISFNPSSFDVSLEPGQVTTQDLTIQNDGTSYLFYSLTPQFDSRLRYNDGIEKPLGHSRHQTRPIERLLPDQPKVESALQKNDDPAPLGHGGPDEFGYTWIDSHQPHGPTFNWVDISGVGTPVNLGNDSYDGPFELGFEFPFYENSYFEIYICSNGYLEFGGGHTYNVNWPIPYPGQPNNVIVPWWDNLNPELGGNIYYYQDTENSRFIVSFIDVEKDPYSTTGFVTFQAILYPDGQIDFNYLDMYLEILAMPIDFYTATIGIENADGTDGLEILYNAAYFFENLSIVIKPDWLAVTPFSGYIAPGENITATVSFNSKNTGPGAYERNIYLGCNDPDEPSIVIPVSLEVTSGCDYIAGDCNHNGTPLELGDVVVMIGLYRGTSEADYTCACPPHGDDFAPVADPNGNCIAFELSDVVTEIAAYRGTGEATGCEDCPGARRITGPERTGRFTTPGFIRGSE